MSMNDIFWLFLMLTALQPVLRHNMPNAARAHKIARLESQRNSRVILLVHRQKTMRHVDSRLPDLGQQRAGVGSARQYQYSKRGRSN